MNVIKRSGREVQFDRLKIYNAIMAAFNEVYDVKNSKHCTDIARNITDRLRGRYKKRNRAISVEEIQDDVEIELFREGEFRTAKAYIKYRFEHDFARNDSVLDNKILALTDGMNEVCIQENSNKNPHILSTQRDYIAGEVSRDMTNRLILPEDIRRAHEEGLIHYHDADYAIMRELNCCLVNLEDMLQNGTVINNVLVEKPHRFSTACTIATQIMAQLASSQYGGQTITLTHLAPFVEETRIRAKDEVKAELIEAGVITEENANTATSLEIIDKITEERVHDDVRKGVQTMQYQINTLLTTNGQAPFVTLFMYLNETDDEKLQSDLAMVIEEVVKQRLQGVKNEVGAWITPAFPKLVYVLDEDNITENSKYWYLTELCAKCTAKRMVPDYISAKVMRENKIDKTGEGRVYPCMGCRSFLTPYIDPETNEPKYYGRFNQGVVTINLPDVGISAGHNFNVFWKILEDRLELCHRALKIKHDRLVGTLSDASPIHFQHGALARLQKGETIDKLLYGGYSTISLGYAGLYECVKAMTGKSHTDPEAKEFALQIMQYMNSKCAQWRLAENIDYSVYGTPIETVTEKFAKSLQRRFGVIEGMTDKNYVTNSYHVVVTEEIDAFDKLKFESEFQKLSPGGCHYVPKQLPKTA